MVGKPLTDFVAPEYVELVENNLRRRLAGEPSAERYEVELVGLHGEVTRVELSSTLIDSAGEPALLLTALEMLPRRDAGRRVVPAARHGDARCDGRERHHGRRGGPDRLHQSRGRNAARPDVSIRSSASSSPTSPRSSTNPTGVRSGIRCARRLPPAAGSRWASAPCWCPPMPTPERSVEISVTPLKTDAKEILGLVLVLHDTSELRGLTRQMTYQASHDALTGLVNRREFERRLHEAIDSAQTGDAAHALCYLDLDRFKVVNDTCGHTAGDNMLREVATILKEAVRDSDTAGRIGGDEFALLLVGCPLDKARQIADDVVRSVNDYRFVWKDKIFNVGVSIGLVEIGRDGGSIEDIMNSADSACYVAKKQGGVHVHVYSAREEASARHSGEIQWLQKLQGALRDNKFELYYQPIVHAHGCRRARPGARGVRAIGRRERPARRIAGRIHPCRRALPLDAARRPLGGAGGAVGPGPRRAEAAAGTQRRDQHRRTNARRCGLPGVRRRLLRSHRSESRRYLLRSHRERGGRQSGPCAPVHRGAARHGL